MTRIEGSGEESRVVDVGSRFVFVSEAGSGMCVGGSGGSGRSGIDGTSPSAEPVRREGESGAEGT